jgi:tryptophan synthase alpha chain
LSWILDALAELPAPPAAPLVLMSYLNPLLAVGPGDLASRAFAAGVAGFVVPDLPLEESGALRESLEARELALVGMVTPATPPRRMEEICRRSRGFVYAVTMTGTTGARAIPGDPAGFLRSVRERSAIPVLAGFGVRTASQVRSLGKEVDGVIVGSALMEEMEEGRDPVEFLRALRAPSVEEAEP